MPDPTLPLDHMSDRAKEVLADHHKLGSQFPAPNFGGEAILVELVGENGSSIDLSEAVGRPIVAPTSIDFNLLGTSLQLAIDKDTITLSLSYDPTELSPQIQSFHFEDANDTIADIVYVDWTGTVEPSEIEPHVTWDEDNIWLDITGASALSNFVLQVEFLV
jgi:hypothetical protein